MSYKEIFLGQKAGDDTGTKLRDGGGFINDNFRRKYHKTVPITEAADFGPDTNGVIQLLDYTLYEIKDDIDLNGLRLVGGVNTAIVGSSSEIAFLRSTGLSSEYLLRSNHTITLRHLTITAQKAINLDGLGNTMALDWAYLNFTNCAEVGIIKDCDNFIYNTGAFLSSTGLVFDGTIGTIALNNSLFVGLSSGTIIKLPDTINVTRRFRITDSSIVSFATSVGIDVDVNATIPDERYILDNVNFTGGATYLQGIDDQSNKSLFKNCIGIQNTSVTGQMYMRNNTLATVITLQGVFFRVNGVTTAGDLNSKFSHLPGRLTCEASIKRKYLIQAIISFTSGNSRECRFGFFSSKTNGILTASVSKSTTRSNGRSENVVITDIIEMEQGEYIEIFCSNDTDTANITVEEMNVVAYEIL